MGIGLTEDQRDLARMLQEWAADTGTTRLTKDSEERGPKVFETVWDGLTDLGVPGIPVPEALGGAGGSLLDVAVALEACAHGMVPGPVLPTLLAAVVLSSEKEILEALAEGSICFGVGMGRSTVTVGEGVASGEASLLWGARTSTRLLVPTAGPDWLVVGTGETARAEAAPAVDLSCRVGLARLDSVPVDTLAVVPLDALRVHEVAVVLAAAEAAGIARWCLETAVEYAKVREQFGRPIGSFQAVKHLCAEMLEAAESATAVAWAAAGAYEDAEQFSIAAAVAGAVALDAAVVTAQNAIQVLGGIGFTWEHDAHLYLRRAMVNRQLVGGSDRWRLRLADLALTGVRRRPQLELGGAADRVRAEVRPLVEAAAALPDTEQRVSLVGGGLLMPHWPAPYGRGAGPVEQLVIDEELATAGVVRPDLGIGAWAVPTILEHGNDAQRERFVQPTLLGDLVWCQLFSEPGAGSDLASLRTRAERTEGGWLLTGQKVWTSVAALADWGICLARTDPDVSQHKGITYFLVDMHSAGIEVRPLRELTGEELFNEVFLDGVFVPDECVVGAVGGGWPLARTTLANERVAISGSSLGVSVERALRHAGAPHEVGELVRLRLGEAVGAAGTTKALALRGTLRSIAGHGPGPESSVLKLVGVRERQDSAELALDLLGEDVLLGRGEGPAAVHEALVTRCLSIAGGTTQVLRNVAAERILGLPRS